MKGLVIWAQSDCRSLMGMYKAVREQLGVPVIIALWFYPRTKDQATNRTVLGLKAEEFEDVPRINVGEDWEKGKAILDEHPGFCHLFAMYQGSPNFRALLCEAKRRGERVGVISESPCNMDAGLRGWVKKLVYLKYILPHRVKGVIEASDFVLNLSGDSTQALRSIGWPDEKVIPFGYFSPPMPGSRCAERTTNKDFTILVTGIMQWHRAPDVAMKAFILLKKWGVPYRAVFTQKGPLLETLKQMAEANNLPVTFAGFLPIDELNEKYATCSLYLAAGRSEPWGMRLNDALQCGAPLAASRGMGGVQMIDEYGCGFTFNSEDYVELAYKIRRMIEDAAYYETCAKNAYAAAKAVSPESAARRLIKILRSYWG